MLKNSAFCAHVAILQEKNMAKKTSSICGNCKHAKYAFKGVYECLHPSNYNAVHPTWKEFYRSCAEHEPKPKDSNFGEIRSLEITIVWIDEANNLNQNK